MTKTAAYANEPGSLLTKGEVVAASLGTGVSYTFDLLCGGDSVLKVMAELTGSANGDLTVTVAPFQSNGTSLLGVTLPVDSSTGPTHVGGLVSYVGEFDVTAFDKVRVTLKNNNAGTQTLNRASWRLA